MAKTNSQQTSRPVASKASSLLRSEKTGAKVKSVAGSALSQTKPPSKPKYCLFHDWPQCRLVNMVPGEYLI